jgi:hypothetical protein
VKSPLVFVHGVSNRDTPEYRDNQVARDALLREYVVRRLGLDAHNVAILNPYWGDYGVKFRWDNASLPESFDSMETFGTGLDQKDLRIATDIVAPLEPGTTDIVTVARRSLTDAVDVVWGSALSAAETAELAAALAGSSRTAFDYAAVNPAPDWLATASNDNFVDLLLYHIKHYEEAFAAPSAKDKVRWERFGVASLLDNLNEGLSRVTALAPSAMSAVTVSLGRKKSHLVASMFLGDVFEYLTKRGERNAPGPIVTTVLGALQTAREQLRADDSKLIIVGHSLGGVISYDVLTHFDPSLEVDVFVTVGSQVALFEEMGLYTPTH